MDPGDSAAPLLPAAETPVTPVRRWKRKLWLGMGLVLLLVLAPGLLLLPRKPSPAQTGLLKFKLTSPFPSPMRMETLTVENRGASALLLWEPCRIERQETGRIVVAGSTTRTLVLMGTNGAGPKIQFLNVQLTGTNHGPWRLLVPVARYEWLARLEKLQSKRMGNLVSQIHLLDSLLQHSRTWVASEWFEERSFEANRPGAFPGRPPGAFSGPVPAPPVSPTPTAFTHRDDFQTFFFLVRNFSHRYRRWPLNLAEIKQFAADPANLQPEFPPAFENETFKTATFKTNSDGGLRIEYPHGTINLGGPPK